MQIHFRRLMIICIVPAIFASCAKTNTQGKLIPKEAAFVITMDGKSLSAKLPWDEIKKNPLFKEINDDSSLPAALKSLLDNPETSGVNTETDLLFFVVKDSIGGYIGFEGTVKDETIFKAFNKQIAGSGVESEKDDVQFISKFPVCVGWTKEKFVYVFDVPQLYQTDELTKRMIRDSISVNKVRARDIGAACKAVFALKESNSLGKDERFTGLMKETGDVHFWVNAEQIIKGGSTNTSFAMIDLDKFYEGSVTTATMNFEDGRMMVNAKTYALGKIIDIFKKYSGAKVNEEMIKRMPGKDIAGVMALGFKPEALRELIQLTGLEGLLNLNNIGFSFDDLIKANKGDILVGVSDVALKPDTTAKFMDQDDNMPGMKRPEFNFIFAASIGNKESFNKLINAGEKLGHQFYGDKKPFSFSSSSDWFALSNNKQSVDQFLAPANTNFDFINKISGEPFGGYLDIQTVLKAFKAEATKDSSAKIAYEATLNMWSNIIWKGGNYSDGGISHTVEINLVDKSTNSLKQLNQYAAKLSELYKELRRKQKQEVMAFQDFQSAEDTTATRSGKTK
ncbi:MAG: DUF4836 family protein [Ferruginibacter sp.]